MSTSRSGTDVLLNRIVRCSGAGAGGNIGDGDGLRSSGDVDPPPNDAVVIRGVKLPGRAGLVGDELLLLILELLVRTRSHRYLDSLRY
jgi:hypothetical protein